jgi:hypothetical protein
MSISLKIQDIRDGKFLISTAEPFLKTMQYFVHAGYFSASMCKSNYSLVENLRTLSRAFKKQNYCI